MTPPPDEGRLGDQLPPRPTPPPGGPAPERDPHSPLRNALPEFDGIRELDSSPPKVWTYLYLLTFLASLWLWFAYPAWPWFGGATRGYFEWSSRAELSRAVEQAEAGAPPIARRFAAASWDEINADPELRGYGAAAGRGLFGENCAPCHGIDGRGNLGFPNLTDGDWLWGGTPEAIEQTLHVGIRWAASPDTRTSLMPGFGAQRMLEQRQVLDLVEWVRAASGQEHDAAAAARAAPAFLENCASCHGEDARGNQEMGAPNLTDAVWLYGGGRKEIYESLWHGRGGVMPAFAGRLSEDMIRKLVLHLRSLGE
ncbi:cytochrome-c oxidase, cbb3-type subunit III [Pseudoroseomonas rhizosphaerae]|uniref:Cbb3-type cytochrome c oxidase subunit n=1 Tax=Teichococcus rhizosphaerae TaxID=1335062 RepID=A0A2C7A818_9PROT|nr:cytochrome-c oxidase, cbb3-type subunit III [Pseudoroseomonas rhizosphaerae]PHK93495.1 cytochrome-c oxidase, cbb3-type subunit III [Pseudoroseomonas rhizosphaerae]